MIPEFLLSFIWLFTMIRTLKSSYKFVRIFPLFYRTFSTQKKAKISFPIYRSFSPSSLFSLHVSTFIFLLIIDDLCERRNYSDFYYHAQLWNNVSNYIKNLNLYVVKSKKSENNSAPSWVRTRALVVRRLERRSLTCEIVATALRLLVTWPKAWDASISYEFVVFIFYTE